MIKHSEHYHEKNRNTPSPTIENILGSRKETYGDWKDQSHLTQIFKDAAKQNKGWKNMDESQMESLEMIFSKIARIINGDSNYKDSWTDIIGYATLIEKTL